MVWRVIATVTSQAIFERSEHFSSLHVPLKLPINESVGLPADTVYTHHFSHADATLQGQLQNNELEPHP